MEEEEEKEGIDRYESERWETDAEMEEMVAGREERQDGTVRIE